MKTTVTKYFKRGSFYQSGSGMTKITFDQLGHKGTSKGKCDSCGKIRQKSDKVTYSVNGFGKMSEEEILEKTKSELLEWLECPFKCKCGGMIK